MRRFPDASNMLYGALETTYHSVKQMYYYCMEPCLPVGPYKGLSITSVAQDKPEYVEKLINDYEFEQQYPFLLSLLLNARRHTLDPVPVAVRWDGTRDYSAPHSSIWIGV